MSRLLSANFMRLRRSKVFWVCVAVMVGFALLMQVFHYQRIAEGGEPSLEKTLFSFVPLVGIAVAAFASLFMGTEYSDGTIRNKVVIGHSRRDIYLSNLVTAVVSGMVLCAVYIVVYSLTGVAFICGFTAEPKAILVQILCVLVLTAALAAIFTLLAMTNQNKAVSAVICVLLAFGLLFAGSFIGNRLEEPEYYEGYYMDETGTMQQGEPEKNPSYLEGTTREVYEFVYDFLPGGQQIQMASGGAAEPWKLMGYSVIITVVATAAGALIFRKKDLR